MRGTIVTAQRARMGAPPKGVDHVDATCGSEIAKERAKVLFRLIAGEYTRQGAADAMGVSVRRVRQLREVFLESAVAALEPGQPGRPRNPEPSAEERRMAELEAEADMLAWELKTARLAEEIDVILPSAGRRRPGRDEAREKPGASRRSRRAGTARRKRPRRR